MTKNTMDLTALRQAATEAYNKQDWKQVIKLYTEIIKQNPKDTETFNNRGATYLKLKQFDQAIKDFDQAIELDPKNAKAFYNRGTIYTDLEQFDQAIEDFDQAIRLNPKDANAFYNRGNAYRGINQFDQAIKDFDQAIEINPTYIKVFNNRGNAYANLEQFDQAIEDFDQAIRLNPKDANAFNNRGATYFKLKQFNQAIKDFDQAIELDPKNASAFNNRGITYRKLKKEDKAINDLKKAVDIDPSIISQKQTKEIEENLKEDIKKTQASNKKVQEFQKILEELREEHQKEEGKWFKRSKWAVGITLALIALILILVGCSLLKSSDTYVVYIFSSIVTFTIIRQYTNAKSMRIEASNRVAMAKMFERVKQEKQNPDYQKEFLPKLADAIVYSTAKEKNNTDGLVEKIRQIRAI